MSNKARLGDGADNYYLNAAIVGTTVMTSDPIDMSDKDYIGVQLITTSTGQGSWTAEVSNNWVPTANGNGSYGQLAGDTTAVWSPYTVPFLPAVAAVTTASNQATAAEIAFRAVRFKFTPTSGAGTVQVLVYAKSYS